MVQYQDSDSEAYNPENQISAFIHNKSGFMSTLLRGRKSDATTFSMRKTNKKTTLNLVPQHS